MALSIGITNNLGERLDTLVEGPGDARETIIFVHGFATDKHETGRFFDDLSLYLGRIFRIVRFDFSGCGKSEGQLEEKDYEKWSEDLKSVIVFTKKKYPGKIHILAQSMGCFITALSNPQGIDKTVFTGLPNSNTGYIIERLIERFGSREGAIIDMENISILPRSSGTTQKIGPTFWKILRLFKPVSVISNYAKNTSLMVLHPNRDEIVGGIYLSQYGNIPGIVIKKINGDHSFRNREDRMALESLIKEYLTGGMGSYKSQNGV